MARAAWSLLLVSAALAGCTSDDAPRGAPDADGGRSQELASFSESFVVQDCPDPFLYVAMDRAELQAYLPPGFVAGDAVDSLGGFFQVFDRQDGRPRFDASDLGAFLIQMVGCTGGDGPTTDYDEAAVGVFIQPPEVEGERQRASLDFYLLDHAVPTPWFAELMGPTGWAFDGDVTMTVEVASSPSPRAQGSWANASGPVYSVDMSAPIGPDQVAYEDILARYWQVLPGGVGHYDHLASGVVVQAATLSCSASAGSVAAMLLGGTDCTAPDRVHEAAILLGHDPTVSFTYLHGATV